VRNLLQETIGKIEEHGASVSDVQWVQSTTDHWRDGEAQWCSWEEFAARADFAYDAGYGAEQIMLALKVIGSDWWLERHEYDGSEWWEFKTLPIRPEAHNPRLRIRIYGDDAKT